MIAAFPWPAGLVPARTVWRQVPGPAWQITSRFDRWAQRIDLVADRWEAELTFAPRREREAAALFGLLAGLGGAGAVAVPDFGWVRSGQRGAWSGARVSGYACATEIAVNVTPAGGSIAAGDRFGLGGRMHVFLEPLEALAGWRFTGIWPPLRAAADQTPVVRDPARITVPMRLAEPGGWGVDFEPGGARGAVGQEVVIGMVEALA